MQQLRHCSYAILLILAALHVVTGIKQASASPIGGEESLKPLPQSIEYNRDKAKLGKRLFFDTRLSSDGSISCASCHIPEHGGAEPRVVSTGVHGHKGAMNAPSVYNAYFNFRQFWNGRADNLQKQAAGPLSNPIEMNFSEQELERYINADKSYAQSFLKIYGVEHATATEVTDAIAEFEKALITPNALFDRYLRGEVELEPDQAEGYRLFKSLGCITCHNGINIGGNSYQYLGAVNPVPHNDGSGDLYSRTGNEFDKNRFKVPSLRNIALTAPYLHDGSQPALRDVLKIMAYHNISFRLTEQEIDYLIAFLNTLTGETPEIMKQP